MSSLVAPASSIMTEDEYLAMERASSVKHELWNGEVFAMTGGTLVHAMLAMNTGGALINALRGQRCQVLSSDAKIYVPRTRGFVYPDLSVVCGKPLTYDDAPDILVNPSLVVEVLSESTEGFDRGEKFAGYRSIISLDHYMLVSQKVRRVEVYSRQNDASWLLRIYDDERPSILLTDMLGVAIQLPDIYRGVLDDASG